MIRAFALTLYKILSLFDYILKKSIKRSFLIWFKEFIEADAYKKIYFEKEIKLFTPNYLTNWLAQDFFEKEPETIEWINSFYKFKIKKKSYFGMSEQILEFIHCMQEKNIKILML